MSPPEISLLGLSVTTLHGESTTFEQLANGRAVLVVNVASRCGLTPQYAKLETLQQQLHQHGFTVIGFPCNQFGGQEPGSAEEIFQFCSATYGVTFPMSDKVDVNGPERDPIFAVLAETADATGYSGNIRWNFEKFLVAPDGTILSRFSPPTQPDAPEVRDAIAAILPG